MPIPKNCLKIEKSDTKSFQFSVWLNEAKDDKNIKFVNINIKKFKRDRNGRIDYSKFEQINMSVEEFEYFKRWINLQKRKK